MERKGSSIVGGGWGFTGETPDTTGEDTWEGNTQETGLRLSP
jgi:hypothetical protein